MSVEDNKATIHRIWDECNRGNLDVIDQCFADNFGSRVEAFMPRLFSMRNRDGAICGAFGLRSANRNLFLEQYLDTPIEHTIAARVGGKVERRGIVEVGSDVDMRGGVRTGSILVGEMTIAGD